MSDRDQSIDRACIDAETLAMWAEGALPASTAASVEAHVSDCARCQELVATFALTEPDVAATSPAFVPTRAPWLQRYWLPLAGGLVAATLLVIVARRESAAPPQPEMRSAKVEAPVAQPIAPSPAVLPEPQPAAGTAPGGAGQAAKPSPAPARKREVMPKFTLSPEPRTLTETRPAAAPAPPPPPPQMPAPIVAAPRPAAQAPPPSITGSIVGGVAGGVTAGAATGTGRMSANDIRAELAISGRDARVTTPIFEFASPGGAPGGGGGRGGGRISAAMNVAAPVAVTRWRVVIPSKVERSIDDGKTWTTVDLGSEPVSIISGMAPSKTTCWLVGKAGLVLRSADGIMFARVTLPETLDLVAVTATDLLNATVTAAGGRQFTTTDGGLTWKERQP